MKYPSDACKEYVLEFFPSAKAYSKGSFVIIKSGPVDIGTGFSEASAWVAAKYYIMSQQDKKKEEEK